MENLEQKLQFNKFFQRDDSIKAEDRIIAWPRMGHIDVPMKALVEGLGAKVIMPPANNKEALEIGVKNSIEGICLPYKLNLANYIMALEMGANTLMMFQAPGSCRFGNYTKMAQKTLRKMGYKFDMIVFDMYQSKMKQTLQAFWHVTRCLNPWNYYRGFSMGFNKTFAVDTAEKLMFYCRPRELNKGDSEKMFNKWLKIINETNSVAECKKLKKRVIEDFKNVAIDKDKDVPVVYLLGEFFVLLDPFTNQDIEKTLGELGVEVRRQIWFSDWLEHVLQPSFLYKKESHRDRCVRYAKDYMKRPIGGECIETIGDAVYAAKHGVDGVIHIMPFSCMPEIVSQNILAKVSKNENLPVLTLVLDEQTGKTGYITRIEAFIDLVNRKRFKEKELNKREGALV
ncbi:MAG: CoA protein activase [Cyanobacteria bacterium SIG29]|nr:CoA protein activase [Cyanobacteria bacterium SIG29]